MKYIFNVSPNLRQKQSTQKIMLELTIALLIVFGFSLAYYFQAYGMDYVIRALVLMACSVLTALVTEVAFAFFMKKGAKFDLKYVGKFLNSSFGWITAIILVLMTPISIRPFALIVSTFLCILFGKLLFGGFGNNIFNPAAVGRAIIFATFMGATTDVVTTVTPTTTIATEFNWLVLDSDLITEMMDAIGGLGTLFTGWYPGALGETSALLILILGVILAIRKVIDWRIPTIYLGSIFVLTAAIALFRGVGSYGNLPGFIWYPLVHVLTGGVVFGAVFMLTDPVTSPTSAQGKTIFALGAAIITVLIRIKANLPEGCLYSILMMNMLTPMIERALDGKQLALRKKAAFMFGGVAIVGLGSVLLAASAVQAKEPDPKVFVATSDAETQKFDARIDASVDNGDGTTTFTVAAQGYHSLEDASQYNIFEIIVNTENKTIVSVKPTTIVDTEYVGDKILDEGFLAQFNGLDLSADVSVERNDAVTGATYSARSTVRAVQEVRSALGY